MRWITISILILLAALVLRLELLAYAMYVFLAVLLLSRLLSRTWSENLAAERECNRLTAEVGDTVAVVVTLENRGRIPIAWLLAEDLLPRRALMFRPPDLQVQGRRIQLQMIRSSGRVSLRYQLTCNRRGYYQLGPLVAETGDLFGLHRRFRVVTAPQFLGLEDLVASLQWVRREIAAFGGDPDRVMIFGESAGGVNVCTLLASPASAGLFHSALIQSGGCVANTRDKALTAGATLSDAVGCSTAADEVACLRGKTAAELILAVPPVVSVTGGQPPYQPNADGTLLPGMPLEVIVAGQHNRVPVVIGSNADETGRETPIVYSDADYAAFLTTTFVNPMVRSMVEERYSAARFGSARAAFVALTSDAKFTCPARRIARALSASQTEPVYRYFFTEVPDGASSALFGAFHGLELAYLFGVMNVAGYTPTAAETTLSARMQQYWGSFASGAPQATGAPTWTEYDPASDSHLVLNADALAMGEGVRTADCDFWESLGV